MCCSSCICVVAIQICILALCFACLIHPAPWNYLIMFKIAYLPLADNSQLASDNQTTSTVVNWPLLASDGANSFANQNTTLGSSTRLVDLFTTTEESGTSPQIYLYWIKKLVVPALNATVNTVAEPANAEAPLTLPMVRLWCSLLIISTIFGMIAVIINSPFCIAIYALLLIPYLVNGILKFHLSLLYLIDIIVFALLLLCCVILFLMAFMSKLLSCEYCCCCKGNGDRDSDLTGLSRSSINVIQKKTPLSYRSQTGGGAGGSVIDSQRAMSASAKPSYFQQQQQQQQSQSQSQPGGGSQSTTGTNYSQKPLYPSIQYSTVPSQLSTVDNRQSIVVDTTTAVVATSASAAVPNPTEPEENGADDRPVANLPGEISEEGDDLPINKSRTLVELNVPNSMAQLAKDNLIASGSTTTTTTTGQTSDKLYKIYLQLQQEQGSCVGKPSLADDNDNEDTEEGGGVGVDCNQNSCTDEGTTDQMKTASSLIPAKRQDRLIKV